MVKSRLISILMLVGLLLVVFFGSIGISAQAQELQPAEPTPPFKEPFPVEREVPVSGTTLDVKAIEASGVYTNVLGTDDGNIHGLIYHDGYLWASTRTAPARVLKISPVSLSVVSRATLAYNNAEDIVAVDYDQNGNYYLWVVLRTSPARLARVNPVDMTAVVHPLTGMNSGTAIWYAFDKLWVGGWDYIAEVDISNPDSISFILHNFSGLRLWNNVVTASIRADLSYLYVAFLQRDTTAPDGYRGTTIARIDPVNPTVNPLTQYVVSDHPDDMVFTDDHLYTSGEDEPDPSVAYRFPTSLTPYTSNIVSNSASYGVFHTATDPGNIWGAYIGEPGVIKKFDLSLDPVWSFNLPQDFDDPSEIVFDENGNMYVSTWQNPSGMIRYTIPDAVTLSISRSGGDAELSWINSDPLVDHYEIWRSTDPYFTIGGIGASPYVTVTASVGTISYTDDGVITDTAVNYYYSVRAFNDFGLYAPVSNRVGEFAISIVPNWNLLAWPLIPTDTSLDSAVGDQLFGTENPTTADRILVWNEITQSYQTAWFCSGPTCESWGEDYYNHWLASDYSQSNLNLLADEGFWVQNRSGGNETLIVTGEVSETDRSISVGSNWQMLGSAFPSAKVLDDANITATGTENPQTADRILYWDQVTQTYRTAWLCGGSICEGWGEPYYNHWLALNYSQSDITLEPGHGFWLQNRHSPFTWINPY